MIEVTDYVEIEMTFGSRDGVTYRHALSDMGVDELPTEARHSREVLLDVMRTVARVTDSSDAIRADYLSRNPENEP